MVDQLQELKKSTRTLALLQRREFINKGMASHQIIRQIISWLEQTKADHGGIHVISHIGAYVAMADEVDTRELFHYCWEQGIGISVPKVESKNITFYEIKSFADVEEGYFHVMEPIPNQTKYTAPEMMQWLIIPLVAFDAQGNRLGYGKGFYDRYLANYQGKGIGVAFEIQRMDNVPVDVYDEVLECICTELKCYEYPVNQVE